MTAPKMSDLIGRLEAAAQWDGSPSWLIHEAIDRIRTLEAQLAERVKLDPDMPAQQLRMHLGEMTAQELRTARAAIRLANSVLPALEAQGGENG